MRIAIFIKATVINISAQFHLYPPYGFWGDDLFNIFLKLKLSIVMATNQIRGLDKSDMFGKELIEEHFCKTLVKIPAVT